MKKTIIYISIILICAGYCYAIDVEHFTSTETISSQSVQKDAIISPYNITGESLVQLLQNMSNFDVAGSNIVFNRRTAQIFVRNTPSNQEVVKSVLSKLRQARQHQVEIEARIITVSATDIDDIGLDFLNWGGGWSHGNRTFGTLVDGDTSENLGSIDFPNIADSNGNPLGGQLAFATTGASFEIESFVDMLKSRAEVNTLSAPHLVVANNQRANIKIEKAQYYVQSVTTDADSTKVAIDPHIGVASSGTILDVTPSINADNTITLEMHPQFVTVDISNTQTVGVAGSNLLDDDDQPSVTLPVFNVQTADTTITIENGGVAMIGGLIEEQETKRFYKIPVLGDIPILGKLAFSSDQVQEVKTHLVIFVKATIKNEPKPQQNNNLQTLTEAWGQ